MADTSMTVSPAPGTDIAYAETFDVNDSVFRCVICRADVTDNPCPDHAPTHFPGLKLVDCDATPRHWVWVHDRDDYGTPCFYCDAAVREKLRQEADRCRHKAWRRTRTAHWLAGKLYVLGITATGGGYKSGDGCDGCLFGSVHLRGRRRYILGVDRDTWRCWRRGHRRGEPIGFGFCGKCLPCPECGSVKDEHPCGGGGGT